MMPLKTFVINLEKDAERMASIDRQLKQLGLVYERIYVLEDSSKNLI